MDEDKGTSVYDEWEKELLLEEQRELELLGGKIDAVNINHELEIMEQEGLEENEAVAGSGDVKHATTSKEPPPTASDSQDYSKEDLSESERAPTSRSASISNLSSDYAKNSTYVSKSAKRRKRRASKLCQSTTSSVRLVPELSATSSSTIQAPVQRKEDVDRSQESVPGSSQGRKTSIKFVERGALFGDLARIPVNRAIDPPRNACFNCWQFGHRRGDCPRVQRQIYCYNCGRRGVEVSHCPRCMDTHRELNARKRALSSKRVQHRPARRASELGDRINRRTERSRSPIQRTNAAIRTRLHRPEDRERISRSKRRRSSRSERRSSRSERRSSSHYPKPVKSTNDKMKMLKEAVKLTANLKEVPSSTMDKVLLGIFGQ